MSSFDDLMGRIKYEKWHSARYQCLDRLERVLTGTHYAHLPYPFSAEVEHGTSTYIPLSERRPSVIYKLASDVVKDAADKLFSGRHWPHIITENETLEKDIDKLVRESNLQDAMKDAVIKGSVGSVAITFKFVDGQLCFDVWNPKFCLPVFLPNGELKSLKVFFKVPADSLLSLDYNLGDDPEEWYWWAKEWTTTEEVIYKPVASRKPPKWAEWPKDPKRSTAHNLGFVPGKWIYNLSGGVLPDGACTFEDLLDITIEIDYQLSQAGRGLKASMSPQLMVRGLHNLEVVPGGATVVRSPANVIEVQAGNKEEGELPGDAKLLEMQGAGLRVVMEYVKLLRAYGLESAKGSRKDPERMTAIPMSGKAMETLEEELIDLVEALRTSYGKHGLLPLYCMVIKAATKMNLMNDKYSDEDLKAMKLFWPKIILPSPPEIQQYANALAQAILAGYLDQETCSVLFQIFLDIPNPIPITIDPKELAAIKGKLPDDGTNKDKSRPESAD